MIIHYYIYHLVKNIANYCCTRKELRNFTNMETCLAFGVAKFLSETVNEIICAISALEIHISIAIDRKRKNKTISSKPRLRYL